MAMGADDPTVSYAVNTSVTASPTSVRSPHTRKRTSSYAGFSTSPGSPHEHGGSQEEEAEGHDEDGVADIDSKRRHQPGVKRACNECRQQKLRCDVQQSPFKACSRCLKQGYICKIDASFRRVGKRSMHADMEREITSLKADNQTLQAEVARLTNLISNVNTPSTIDPPNTMAPNMTTMSGMYTGLPAGVDQFAGSHDAITSLLDLKQGVDNSAAPVPYQRRVWHLENVILATERVYGLFEEYFTHYNPFLPLLRSPAQGMYPEAYFEDSELLFWTIITVAARKFAKDTTLVSRLSAPLSQLVWTAISKVSQNYHDVKALCLLCTWPLPTSSTQADPTLNFCGLMMHTAMHIGLHQPSHPQDFTRWQIQLRQSDIQDRRDTWTACNIVAQSISTGFGQPTMTYWESLFSSDHGTPGQQSAAFRIRSLIEKQVDAITKGVYGAQGFSDGDSSGYPKRLAAARMGIISLDTLEAATSGQMDDLDRIHFRAARLHLRLFAFFSDSQNTTYRSDLHDLYWATIGFLDSIQLLKNANRLIYATNYIVQMMLAAGCTLYKLLTSPTYRQNASQTLDDGSKYFFRTVEYVRDLSVTTNDLPQRYSEVLAQLWREKQKALRGVNLKVEEISNGNSNGPVIAISDDHDDSLQLRHRGRMSMSVIHDTAWRWRETLQGKGPTGNLDSAVNNPTNPEAEASSSSTPVRNLGGPGSATGAAVGNVSDLTGQLADMPGNIDYVDSYEYFDPMSWVLSGPMDFSNYASSFGP